MKPDRREFIKHTALATAGITFGAGLTKPALAVSSLPTKSRGPFSGIQIVPHSFYDEGMDYCLDLLEEKGAINNLLVSFHAYYGAMGRPKHLMADHGVPKPDNTLRRVSCSKDYMFVNQ